LSQADRGGRFARKRERRLDRQQAARRERAIVIARTRSWPGLVAQPQRYIIHRNDGLIQVIRSRLNGGTKRPAATAGPAISGEYAWYTVIVVSVYAARTWRYGVLTGAGT
jgi:hypothetical protein